MVLHSCQCVLGHPEKCKVAACAVARAQKQAKPAREQIGEIGVDAGLCWLGDPCYILHPANMPKELGKDWEDFCHRLHKKEERGTSQFNYDKGHSGLGVCVSTGYGDGCYPVYVTRGEDGRIASVTVEFIEEE